jgi:hypothetical protein
MLSSSSLHHPTPIHEIDGLIALDGVQIVVSRDLRDLTLVDRLADAIDAIVHENAARRTRIQAGVTSEGRRRIDAEHAVNIARHRATLEAVVDAMLAAGTELSVAIEICPILDAFAAGPLRMGSIFVYPAVTPIPH